MESYLKENFEVEPKNPTEEALKKWRSAVWLVKNPRRRFRMVADLAKRAAAEKKRRKIQSREVVVDVMAGVIETAEHNNVVMRLPETRILEGDEEMRSELVVLEREKEGRVSLVVSSHVKSRSSSSSKSIMGLSFDNSSSSVS